MGVLVQVERFFASSPNFFHLLIQAETLRLVVLIIILYISAPSRSAPRTRVPVVMDTKSGSDHESRLPPEFDAESASASRKADFLIVAEFCEIEGPKPLVRMPHGWLANLWRMACGLTAQ